MNADIRARLKDQASVLLDCVTVKLTLTPIGVALDIDFLERVSLFVAAVEDALRQDECDTLRPAPLACSCPDEFNDEVRALDSCPLHDACGRCGHPLKDCPCI